LFLIYQMSSTPHTRMNRILNQLEDTTSSSRLQTAVESKSKREKKPIHINNLYELSSDVSGTHRMFDWSTISKDIPKEVFENDIAEIEKKWLYNNKRFNR